jgi:hypothetical protein
MNATIHDSKWTHADSTVYWGREKRCECVDPEFANLVVRAFRHIDACACLQWQEEIERLNAKVYSLKNQLEAAKKAKTA